MTTSRARQPYTWALCVAIALTAPACEDGDSTQQELDAAPILLPDGAVYDPWWTDFDAGVDIDPNIEPPGGEHAWTDWTSFHLGEQGTATGTLTLASGSVSVTYEGQLYNAQTGRGDAGVNYWKPATPYESVAIPNGPPEYDSIMLWGGDERVHTITFSAPVRNPVLAIMSLGARWKTTVCRFDDEFELLSYATGYFGTGDPLKHLPDKTLVGRESSGAIRFSGTFTRIRWTSLQSEPWYGLTVGTPQM